jgi:quercetin dioxygenase-like cupin family protein
MRHIVLAAALTTVIAGAGSAQQPTFKRTELQRADLSVPNKEAVTASVDIPAGVQSGRHTHPGEEVGYVIEGTLVLELDGKPARTLKAGEAFLIPNGQVHNARNSGTGQARVLATYIIEKGKPIATPVP